MFIYETAEPMRTTHHLPLLWLAEKSIRFSGFSPPHDEKKQNFHTSDQQISFISVFNFFNSGRRRPAGSDLPGPGGGAARRGGPVFQAHAVKSEAWCKNTTASNSKAAYRHLFCPEHLQNLGRTQWDPQSGPSTLKTQLKCVHKMI